MQSRQYGGMPDRDVHRSTRRETGVGELAKYAMLLLKLFILNCPFLIQNHENPIKHKSLRPAKKKMPDTRIRLYLDLYFLLHG